MMNKSSLIKYLKIRGACKQGLAWVRRQEFGPEALEKAPIEHVVWLLNQIGGPGRKQFARVDLQAKTKYRNDIQELNTKYESVVNTAYAEYRHRCDLALEEYKAHPFRNYVKETYLRAERNAKFEYSMIEQSAYDEYKQARAPFEAEYSKTREQAARNALTWSMVMDAICEDD